jgi:hypothetical protein
LGIGTCVFGFGVTMVPIFLASAPYVPFYVVMTGLGLALVGVLVDDF